MHAEKDIEGKMDITDSIVQGIEAGKSATEIARQLSLEYLSTKGKELTPSNVNLIHTRFKVYGTRYFATPKGEELKDAEDAAQGQESPLIDLVPIISEMMTREITYKKIAARLNKLGYRPERAKRFTGYTIDYIKRNFMDNGRPYMSSTADKPLSRYRKQMKKAKASRRSNFWPGRAAEVPEISVPVNRLQRSSLLRLLLEFAENKALTDLTVRECMKHLIRAEINNS